MLSVTCGHGADYLLNSVAGGRESYYLDATTDGEPPGQWAGAGAAAFGLVGEVDAKDMEALYGSFRDPRDPAFLEVEGWADCARLGRAPGKYRSPEQVVAELVAANPGALPEQIAQWRTDAERTSRSAVMFEDATFGVPKSVTVLHAAFLKAELEAQRNGEEQAAAEWAGRRHKVENAVHAGNAAMLAFMAEKTGYARVGADRSGAATQFMPTKGWTVATFFQHTNRDLEPHLHIHNAILNRAETDDRQFRALDGKSIRFWKQAGGAVAERVMQEQMTRTLGSEWRLNTAGHTRELVGIEEEVRDLFSGRTAKLGKKAQALATAAEERLGRELTPLEYNRLRNQANLATRQAKTHNGETQEQMLDRWHAKLQRELAGGLQRVAARFEAPGRPAEVKEISPHAVIVRALDAVQEKRATWTRPELMRQIDLALPDNLGGLDAASVITLIERLTDAAIERSGEVIQTAGASIGDAPAELRRADGTSVYDSPRAAHYATRRHVVAEEALRRAAVDRGRQAVPVAEVNAWLAERSGMLGADQAAAVRGIASSGAGLAVLVGPAGAGKSHTAGALAASWADLTGGRVIGLATTQVATEVLRDDGVENSANTRKWLNVQRRLESGTATAHDAPWVLGAKDIVLIDEASMVSTQQLTEIRQAVDAAGARMVLAGDPAQLGAVGAGGMMALLAGGEAETYSLTDVRRFTDGWERAASLRLRAGDASVVREYDRHGRILDGGTPEDAAAMAGRAYVADRLAGKTSVIVTGTNEDAAKLSTGVRDRLIGLGLVEAEGVSLDRDGTTAGVGDVVAARKIDWNSGVLNRRQYEVLEIRAGGGMRVVSMATGATHELSPEYVAEHVSLGYAGTIHSTEGQTLDTGHEVMDARTARDAAYVGMTRGRESNTAYVVTCGDEPDPLAPNIGVRQEERRTAAAIFADILERDTAEESATAQAMAQQEWAASAATVGARIEDAVRVGCEARTNQALDALVADGVLGEAQRARLGADQGTPYLARVLRAAEQAGHDPDQVLRSAVEGRDLRGVRSVAQVLSSRITSATDLAPAAAGTVPAGLSDGMTAYLEDLIGRQAARREHLGEVCAADPPPWALAAFGPPPAEDGADRARWVESVATVAAHREASGWESEDAAVGPAPGMQATERRAGWHEAWEVLGRPQAQAEEGDLSEGRLRNRVEAWRREEANAPHFADDHLRAASVAARTGEQDATLAEAEGRPEDAAKLADGASTARLAAGALDVVAEERGRWLLASSATRETGVRAEAELEERGIVIGEEPDQVTVQDYLLEVVHEEAGPVIVQRQVAEPPPLVEVAADVPTVAEADAMRRRAEWVGEVLRDRHSHDDAYLGEHEAGWAVVDEESKAWQDAEGHEEALLDTSAVEFSA